jgi:hypothetical protein
MFEEIRRRCGQGRRRYSWHLAIHCDSLVHRGVRNTLVQFEKLNVKMYADDTSLDMAKFYNFHWNWLQEFYKCHSVNTG